MAQLNVLITGGTKGLGLSMAKAYSRNGANVHITHRWGTVTDEEIIATFKQEKLTPPHIYCSDVGDETENQELVKQICTEYGKIDVFISNVAFSQIVREFMEMKRNLLNISLQYSAWPIVSITQQINQIAGSYPRYVIGVSSDGPDICHPGYEFAACSKAVLETLVRYMSLLLRDHKCNVNAIRPGFIKTDSSIQTFSLNTIEYLEQKHPYLFVETDAIANVCLALSSGLMDAVTGQVITIDNGQTHFSPINYCMPG